MIENMPYKVYKYRRLLEKNMVICLFSEHSITMTDIDNMPLLDRDFIYTKLVERQEAIKKRMEEKRLEREANLRNK